MNECPPLRTATRYVFFKSSQRGLAITDRSLTRVGVISTTKIPILVLLVSMKPQGPEAEEFWSSRRRIPEILEVFACHFLVFGAIIIYARRILHELNCFPEDRLSFLLPSDHF